MQFDQGAAPASQRDQAIYAVTHAQSLPPAVVHTAWDTLKSSQGHAVDWNRVCHDPAPAADIAPAPPGLPVLPVLPVRDAQADRLDAAWDRINFACKVLFLCLITFAIAHIAHLLWIAHLLNSLNNGGAW